MEEIRVLHLISTLVSGGVQNVVMGYGKNVRPFGIIFDYIVQGEGNGLIMGVGGGIQDNAVDVTYSSNTGQNLGAAGAKLTTTTTTTASASTMSNT